MAATLSWGRGLERQSREPFWRAVGGVFGGVMGVARGGHIQLFLGNDLERTLEAIQPL